MVSVIKRPTFDVEDVEKILTMHGKDIVQLVVLVDQAGLEAIAGKIKKLMDIG